MRYSEHTKKVGMYANLLNTLAKEILFYISGSCCIDSFLLLYIVTYTVTNTFLDCFILTFFRIKQFPSLILQCAFLSVILNSFIGSNFLYFLRLWHFSILLTFTFSGQIADLFCCTI